MFSLSYCFPSYIVIDAQLAQPNICSASLAISIARILKFLHLVRVGVHPGLRLRIASPFGLFPTPRLSTWNFHGIVYVTRRASSARTTDSFSCQSPEPRSPFPSSTGSSPGSAGPGGSSPGLPSPRGCTGSGTSGPSGSGR